MYREKINDSIGEVYQAGVATKILQYMNKIRNEFDITQARRWVMELLQNARDLAWPDKPLQVQIELGKDALIFRHSGMPFGVDDILSIVNQVSSKNPGEGVEQFGTGFMTTYQLSERVEIHSLLKEEGWPGKEFRITLDRTGHTKEEILQAISRNHYILLYVAYDYPLRQVAGVKVYENLCRQLATGKLVNVAGRYCFEER